MTERKPRIAVLDDDEPFVALMQAILQDEGYRYVRVSGDDDDRVDALVAANVDLAVLDLRGVTQDGGLDLLARIRDRRLDLPILICSADIEALRGRAAELAAMPHVATLEKPFRIEALVGALARLREGASPSVPAAGRSGRQTVAAIEEALERLGRVLRWPVTEAWIPDPRPGLLRCVAGWAASDALQSFVRVSRRTRVPIGSGVAGRVWVSARPAWIEEISTDMNLPRIRTARRVGLRSAAAVPVLQDGAVVGVVAAYSNHRRRADSRALARLGAEVVEAGGLLRAATGLPVDA